jgi:hypothetical protein
VQFFCKAAALQKGAALTFKLPVKQVSGLVDSAEHGIGGNLWFGFCDEVR